MASSSAVDAASSSPMSLRSARTSSDFTGAHL